MSHCTGGAAGALARARAVQEVALHIVHLARARAVQDVALHMGGGGGCNVPVTGLFEMSHCTWGRVHLARDRPGEPRSLFTIDLTRDVRPRKAV